jgi:5'-nucleotidase
VSNKKILYIDLDNTIVDFRSGIKRLHKSHVVKFDGRLDEVPHIFSIMHPMKGAIKAYKELDKLYDTYILSTAPWLNPQAWRDKVEWVHHHLGVEEGSPAYKRLILSHHKNLNRGDFLVDDRPNNGASEFEGKWLEFGSKKYPDWDAVTKYLRKKA